jgi:ATP-dependent metalloprotease
MKTFSLKKFRPSFINTYLYKRNFLKEMHSFDQIEGKNIPEKLNYLHSNNKHNQILSLSTQIKNILKKPDELKTVMASAKVIYNQRESDPQQVARRYMDLQFYESERTSGLLLGSLVILGLYLLYNRDVFYEDETNEGLDDSFKLISNTEKKPKLSENMSSNWFEKLKNRLLGLDNKKEDFTVNLNISERLSDVKGMSEVRDEIDEVVKILKNPKKYEDAGAKLMKGILLVGKPGTGKTLLARSLAGESGVNFIYTTASQFDQKYAGAGSAKLKKLFKKARESSPCIIFIDEIDSLIDKGRRKGQHSSSSERADINTFLAEMDGFKKNEHVFILGATNSIDTLDDAALRPGRFDKIIHVPLPDKIGRNEIFSFYLNKIKLPIHSDINSQRLSEMTPGFSGAEIENMVNLATILAVDEEKSLLNKSSFEDARDRIIMGIKLKSNKNIRYILQRAVHEAGHALVCYKNEDCRRDIHKVSIAKRGAYEGKTSILPDDHFSGTKDEFLTYIQVSLAGIFAEEIYFGHNKVSVGCGNDLNRASSFAKDMVKKYAMGSKDFGYMYIDEGQVVDHKISNDTRNQIDIAADSIVKRASERVREVLNNNVSELRLLTQHLLEYDELDRDDLEKILSGKESERKLKDKVRSVNIDSISV